jgi:hypothetical protein
MERLDGIVRLEKPAVACFDAKSSQNPGPISSCVDTDPV